MLSMHLPCPKMASEGKPPANYSVEIVFFPRYRPLRTLLIENEQVYGD